MPDVDLPPAAVRSLAASALAAEAPAPATLERLAQMCRRAGALDEARALLERLPDGAPGRELLSALRGLPQRPDGNTAAPFHRQTDFLPAEAAAEVLDLATDALQDLVDSTVADADDVRRLDPSTRRSHVATEVDALRRVFMPHVKALMAERGLARRMGLDRDAPGRHELQFTAHGDGCFFKPHTDAPPGASTGRAITFVYYFVNPPRRFSGGDLLLFDGPADGAWWDTTAFTRIAPENNSLIVFPSARAHEVEPVRSDHADLAAGRLTLNGWFHH